LLALQLYFPARLSYANMRPRERKVKPKRIDRFLSSLFECRGDFGFRKGSFVANSSGLSKLDQPIAKINFASDNYSPVHPKVLEWINRVNAGPEPAYGGDSVTAQAMVKIKEHFGESAEAFFVWNGTAANVLALSSGLKPHQCILSSDLAHIAEDECGAPEKWTGSKIIGAPSVHGKINPENLESYFARKGDPHASQIKIISISQTTEYGTVYSLAEIQNLSRFARNHGCFLHMDGARLSNAAVALGQPFREFTVNAGVDLLSFGGTKNGLMGAECVVLFRPELAESFSFIRKQGLHLSSKMRYLSAQFLAYFENDLWKQNATHANTMARKLAAGLKTIGPALTLTQEVHANAVFASMHEGIRHELEKEFYFYVWNAKLKEVRLMCSFDTTPAEVDHFISRARHFSTQFA
jgi:threonine aldolase